MFITWSFVIGRKRTCERKLFGDVSVTMGAVNCIPSSVFRDADTVNSKRPGLGRRTGRGRESQVEVERGEGGGQRREWCRERDKQQKRRDGERTKISVPRE